MENDNKENNENVVKPVVDKYTTADKTIDAVENFIDTKNYKNEYSIEEVNKYKTSAILSYIPLVCLYFIVTSKYKQSKYLFFHVSQGLNVTILSALVFIFTGTINSLFLKDSMVLNSTPFIISFMFYCLYFICFLYSAFGIVNTLNNNSKELPIIGNIKILK